MENKMPMGWMEETKICVAVWGRVTAGTMLELEELRRWCRLTAHSHSG